MFQGQMKRAHRKLQPLWTKLEERWNDERAHHAFLAQLRSSADFAYARNLYRMAAVRASSAHEVVRESNAWRWLAALELRCRRQSRGPMVLNLARTVLLACLLVEASVFSGYPMSRVLAALAVLELGAWAFRRFAEMRRTREAAPSYLLTGA